MTRLITIIALTILPMSATWSQESPPAFPVPPVRTAVIKPLFSPRQLNTQGSSVYSLEKIDVIVASRIGGGYQTNWWGKMWPTNLNALRVVNVTNLPTRPVLQIILEWHEPVTVLASSDLVNWTNITTDSVRTISLWNDGGKKFVRVQKNAADLRVSWTESPSYQVAGYKVYSGPGSGAWTDITDCGLRTSLLVTNATPGQVLYFAVTAYDAAGVESESSNVVSYTVPNTDPVVNIFTR